jgi:small subunit ribosomal protein S12
MYQLFNTVFKKRIKTHRPIKNRRPHLKFCPQKKAQCLKLTVFSPKKPNSARRKVSKIIVTSTKKKTYCYIPGIGHKLKAYSTVLIRGGRRLDVPGMKYTAIRGKYDFEALYARRNARSKFGVKKYR